MTRTRSLLAGTFGRDLASLIYAYFTLDNASPKHFGKLGAFEQCCDLSPEAHNWAVYGAEASGYISLADTLISLGAEWEYAFKGMCRRGDCARINAAIARGMDFWQQGLIGAARGGHLLIVYIMIDHGAICSHAALQAACRSGHKAIIARIIAHGAHCWSCGLSGACAGGHKEIITDMIARGANRCHRCFRSIAAHNEEAS